MNICSLNKQSSGGKKNRIEIQNSNFKPELNVICVIGKTNTNIVADL